MGVIASAELTAALAASVPADHGVHFVPAFVGLGAPHWRTDVRAAITGMTLETGPAHIARAALEAVAFQTCDLIDAMADADIPKVSTIRIDGGMATNDWFAQFLADMMGLSVERPANHECTALGAAYLAGLTLGIWPDLDSLAALERPAHRFEPGMTQAVRDETLRRWRQAVGQLIAMADRVA